eukprot:1120370-Amphidinium_carterae.1
MTTNLLFRMVGCSRWTDLSNLLFRMVGCSNIVRIANFNATSKLERHVHHRSVLLGELNQALFDCEHQMPAVKTKFGLYYLKEGHVWEQSQIADLINKEQN